MHVSNIELVRCQNEPNLGIARKQKLNPSDNPACTQITVDHRYLVPASTGYSYEAVSNPYCVTSEATMGWTVTTRDAMGRVTQSSTYGGATVPGPWTSGYTGVANGISTVAYSAEWTTVGDQAEKKRKNRVDGLGRLVEVVEDPDSLAYSTTYGYDHRDALTTAKQMRTVPGDPASTQQGRYFAYDSLGRLMTAANPESGTTAYTYDDSGNVATSQVASGPVRSYSYNTRN